MCMTKKGVMAFFSSLSLFFPPSSFYQHWAAVPYCMIKETRLVAAFVGRLWYRLTLDCTWMFWFWFFLSLFFGRGGVDFANHGLTETHFPSVVCVWRKTFDVHYFWYKRQFEKKKRSKNTCSVKALFFLFLSENWAGWGRHNTEMSCVENCLNFRKFHYGKYKGPFKTKHVTEATLIKRMRDKKNIFCCLVCVLVFKSVELTQRCNRRHVTLQILRAFYTKFGLWQKLQT